MVEILTVNDLRDQLASDAAEGLLENVVSPRQAFLNGFTGYNQQSDTQVVIQYATSYFHGHKTEAYEEAVRVTDDDRKQVLFRIMLLDTGWEVLDGSDNSHIQSQQECCLLAARFKF